jgi:hypothetical protein
MNTERELDEIKVEYLEAYEAGRAPALEDIAGRYPQYLDELVDFITMVIELDSALGHVPDPPEPSVSTRKLREKAVLSACGVGTLREAIAGAGFAREDVAAATGVPVSFLVRVERGRLVPGADEPSEERFRVRLGKVLRHTGDEVLEMLRTTFEAPHVRHNVSHARSSGDPGARSQMDAQPQPFRALLAGCEDLTPAQRKEWLSGTNQDIPD